MLDQGKVESGPMAAILRYPIDRMRGIPPVARSVRDSTQDFCVHEPFSLMTQYGPTTASIIAGEPNLWVATLN